MLSNKKRTLIFIEAGILTLAVYSFAIFFSFYLDDARVDELNSQILENSLNEEKYYVGSFFMGEFNEDFCEFRKNTIFEKFINLKEFGRDLTNYGSLFLEVNENTSKLKQREYFQDEIELYEQVLDYNEACEDKIFPIIYFYNGLSSQFDKQSPIIDQFTQNHKNKTLVLSFDFYFIDEPNLEIIKKEREVFSHGVIIMNNQSWRVSNEDILNLNQLTIEYKKFKGEI